VRLRLFACVLAAALPLAFVATLGAGCTTPSSSVDGGDLLGVFDRDAAAADAAASDAGQRDAGRKDAGAAPATKPMASQKPVARPPTEGSCVAVNGLPDANIKRTLGRPSCPRAEVLEWKDAAGAPRYACVTTPSGIDTRAPLPLVVFFHDAGDNPRSVDKKTSLRKHGARFDITGDPAHAGFIVLAPQGRALQGNREGARFDIDYTGEDNLDVAATDHFVSVLTSRGHVDRRRIYAMGAGHGGYMAATYAMMRADRIAAFATYASDAPPAAWSCPGPPPPAFVTYRACDEIVPCASVERWLRSRDAIAAETSFLRIGTVNADEPTCSIDKKCTKIVGTALHRRWPKAREEDMLRFLSRHTLSVLP